MPARAREPDPIRRNDGARWESALAPLLAGRDEALWRAHADAVNARLLERWLPDASGRALKTDGYDEAMGAGLADTLRARVDSLVCLDIAPSVLAAARERHGGIAPVAADVRRLPFATGAFDVVISNSTLDHFDSRGEIDIALAEVHRVLAPGGRLLLTMDNGANPLIALRNALPFALLRGLRIVDYPIGATFGPRRLVRVLHRHGFEVSRVAAILHCPRVLAVARARRLERAGSTRARARFARALMRWERAASLPTRFLTGYYVAIDARKR